MRLRFIPMAAGAAATLAVAACSDPANTGGKPARAAPAAHAAAEPPSTAPPAPAVPTPAPLAIPPPPVDANAAPPDDPKAAAINQASWAPGKAGAVSPALVRAEVLLARAHFSPGVIDGKDGANLSNAVAAYEQAHGSTPDGRISAQLFQALTDADPAPAIVSYVISDADVKGPFIPAVPKDFAQMATLDALAYTSPLEGLAEKFHMDQGLLKALNPNADFGRAGTTILVTAAQTPGLPEPVTAIEVDKSARQVRAFGSDGRLLAVYPATVGSAERPAPTGVFSVKGVAWNPVYTYDPKRLTFGDKSEGKLTIKPGPNNPVGVAWIDLSVPTYGIHGAPDPQLVGKAQSHGCVRLTNWDVTELAQAVKPGVKVTFVGVDGAAPHGRKRAQG